MLVPSVSPATPRWGFNVFGHVSGNFGLAVAARNSLRMLQEKGEPFCVVDIDAGGGRSGHDATYAQWECTSRPPHFAVNLIHTNPWDIISYLIDRPHSLDWKGGLNTCVPFWELPRLPLGEWRRILSNVDVVLAPSEHIATAVRDSCPDACVVHYPQAVFVPDAVSPDRSAWGISDDAFVCFMVMDVASDVERKNPIAAYEAFCEAFRTSDAKAQLVVRLNNPRMNARFERDTERVLARMRDDSRVVVVDEVLDYRRVLGLSASCDVLISLHRAEGLGLNLMEAMSLGKPVVATGWSGNLDFMNDNNSLLIGYEFVPVQSSHPSYLPAQIGEDQYWAEPSVADAARALRALYENPSLRISLGARARDDMAAARARFLAGQPMDELKQMLQSERFLGPGRSGRVRALEAAEQGSIHRRLRRQVGRTLRRLGLHK